MPVARAVDLTVVVNTNGQLSVITPSVSYKEAIQPMKEASEALYLSSR
jgi:hypothetical protein